LDELEEKNKPYRILDKIGEGTFGKVYRGFITNSNEIIAIKKVLQDDD